MRFVSRKYPIFVGILITFLCASVPFSTITSADTDDQGMIKVGETLKEMKWKKLTLKNEGSKSICKTVLECTFSELDEEHYLRWSRFKIGIGFSQNEIFDNFIEKNVKKLKLSKLDVFLDNSHPTKKDSWGNRFFFLYRWLLNNLFDGNPPALSINKKCTGSVACSGCVGWACRNLLQNYPNYINTISDAKLLDEESDTTEYWYRRYNLIRSAGTQKFPMDMYLSQYMKLDGGKILRFDCFFDHTDDFQISEIMIAACMLNALGYMGLIDIDRHLEITGHSININSSFSGVLDR